MTSILFLVTAVTLLVITAYAVELLADTYDYQMASRQQYFDNLDSLAYPDEQ
jgi:hypothetical protein